MNKRIRHRTGQVTAFSDLDEPEARSTVTWLAFTSVAEGFR